jgi:hypothetical protein
LAVVLPFRIAFAVLCIRKVLVELALIAVDVVRAIDLRLSHASA